LRPWKLRWFNILEKINLPDAAGQIIKQAVQLGFVITSQEQADALHAAIDALTPFGP
jgi:hypothetical protein